MATQTQQINTSVSNNIRNEIKENTTNNTCIEKSTEDIEPTIEDIIDSFCEDCIVYIENNPEEKNYMLQALFSIINEIKRIH